MKLPSLSFLAQAFIAACVRFPATMFCAFTGVAAVMILIENRGGGDGDPLVKVWMMAQIGLALCTAFTVLAESRGWNRLRNWGLQALALALLIAYYFVFDLKAQGLERIHLPRYVALLAVAHLAVAFAPYLNRWPVADFWEFNKRLFANFIVGAVYSAILFSGLALAILAINELFNLGIDEKIYAHLFVLLAGIFNTAFFLYHFPAAFEFDEQEKAYNVVFKNLCQYILIPIVGLYFLILYAYSVKILLTWTLPKGWVASLVLGFSVAGIFTYLINYMLPNQTDSKTVHAYRRWFWWVLLPMVGLLFVAIARRIADYGITEERFFVAHAGVWLLVVCGYFLWSKSDNIKFIPISLSAFVLIAVLGPFSAFEVARRNQVAILHRLLTENDRFEGGKLKQGGAPVPQEVASRIFSCLVFLEQRGDLSELDSWFPVPLEQIAPGQEEKYSTARTDSIAHWLQINDGVFGLKHNRFVAVYPSNSKQFSGDISGFRRFFRLELYELGRRKDSKSRVFLSEKGDAIILMSADDKTVADSFSLVPSMRQWAVAPEAYYDLQDSVRVINLRGKNSVARLFVQEARLDATELKMQNLNGVLFLK